MIHKLLFSQPKKLKAPAVFLDRDGVLNIKPPDGDYVKSWEEFVVIPEALEIIKWCNKFKYKVVIITNQRGIARKLLSQDDFVDISNRMVAFLDENSLKVDAVYYCPHDYSDVCSCRKPQPALILEAIADYKIDPHRSILIGDSVHDIAAAIAAGLTKYFQIPVNAPETAYEFLRVLKEADK